MDFKEAMDWLYSIPRFATKNEVEKTKFFLEEEIGDFSKSIPTIHVAGTNGKGSVCAYLRAALMESGLKVGMFTSPHLVSVCERFMINEEEISEREFANTLEYVRSLIEDFHKRPGYEKYYPTFFEFAFFMAAVWFKNKKPDVIILETGLGGRLDATNCILKKEISVITEIGLDHTEYLGDTKEKIAFEKAGIIKENTPVVFINKEESVSDVIRTRAKELNAPIYEVSNKNIKIYERNGAGIDFSIQSLYDEFVEIVLNTKALYQTENALIAFRTLEVLSKDFPFKLNREDIVKGFSKMNWPGRMETVADRFVIDGGHNEDGIKAFLESVKGFPGEKKELLYSAVSDKDIEKAASLIKESGLFDKIYVCKLSGYRASGLEQLKEAFGDVKNVEYFENVAAGIGEMISHRSSDTYSFAVGSLYLVGEIKALIYEEEII